MSRRIPFTRIGLTLVVGSVLASLIMFYIGLGASMADMSHEAPATEPKDLFQHFTRHFLFQGTGPTFLFWLGIAVMIVGIIRIFTRPPAR